MFNELVTVKLPGVASDAIYVFADENGIILPCTLFYN